MNASKRLLTLVLAVGVAALVLAGCGGGGGGSSEDKTLTLGSIGWNENIAVSTLTQVVMEDDLGYQEVQIKGPLELGPLVPGRRQRRPPGVPGRVAAEQRELPEQAPDQERRRAARALVREPDRLRHRGARLHGHPEHRRAGRGRHGRDHRHRAERILPPRDQERGHPRVQPGREARRVEHGGDALRAGQGLPERGADRVPGVVAALDEQRVRLPLPRRSRRTCRAPSTTRPRSPRW